MGLQLLPVTVNQKGDLDILLPESLVEIVDFFHQGLLDQLAQSSHVADSILSLIDQLRPCLSSISLVLNVGVSQLVLEVADEFLES